MISLPIIVAVTGLSATVAPAAEDEFLCRPLLPCLSAPGGAGSRPECKSALDVLFERLREGQGFPQCPASRIAVSPEGYAPYHDCDPGERQVTGDRRGIMCEGLSPQGRPVQRMAQARLNPKYVDVTYPDGFHVRLWFNNDENH